MANGQYNSFFQELYNYLNDNKLNMHFMPSNINKKYGWILSFLSRSICYLEKIFKKNDLMINLYVKGDIKKL
ncbi:hypothetical protein RCA_02480 [Rickettsia canadensis str. CA410]|uniref:Uncharacterized protein n=1 Tax=Rickettsia canadensis str. CA410 TaxID=1105107 RepID=A0ABN4AGU2_RICCA|nr:hypothetical protein RCA_02480 [Rickettsia canadensis str. CA410]